MYGVYEEDAQWVILDKVITVIEKRDGVNRWLELNTQAKEPYTVEDIDRFLREWGEYRESVTPRKEYTDNSFGMV